MALECEVCGGANIKKEGSAFICQQCGVCYTLEDVRKLMTNTIDCSKNVSGDNFPNKNQIPVGTEFFYGSYPQDLLSDSSLIKKLNTIDAPWESYDYYISYNKSDYTMYKDVEYKGDKYRAVKFSLYRPYYTNNSSTSHSYQYDNYYFTNEIYWFKYEPIKWKVLNPSSGLCMCTSVLDSQQFYHGDYSGTQTRDGEPCYANSYKHSDIREFLNNNFYNTAFTDDEKINISLTEISSNDYMKSYMSGNDAVKDNIFLLSYSDILNSSYGFSDGNSTVNGARMMKGTEYAKCQGLYVSTNSSFFENSIWWLRSTGDDNCNCCCVYYNGYVNYHYCVYGTDYGVVPAMCISDLDSVINKVNDR